MRKILLLAAALIIGGINVSAQKYGHMNFGNLLAAMPETKGADTLLATYQKELIAKGEVMVKQFQEKYNKFAADVEKGDLSPLQQQERQQALQQEQQTLVSYEQEVAQKLQTRREELLKPIVEKAEKAIEEVAKANGFTMIFDTSTFNAIVFAQDTDDVMPLVKAKLGVK